MVYSADGLWATFYNNLFTEEQFIVIIFYIILTPSCRHGLGSYDTNQSVPHIFAIFTSFLTQFYCFLYIL